MKVLKCICLSLIVSNVYAALYEINQDHSHLNFSIPYMMVSEVTGAFKKYEGTFEYDKSSKTFDHVTITIHANSIDTTDPKRDLHLKRQDFFFVATYPLIQFKSGPFKVEKDLFQVPGELDLRGVKKPVLLKGKIRGHIIDPWGKESLFLEGEANLNRKDFGMVWNKELDDGGLLVGDEVKVSFLIQGQIQGQKTPFSTHMTTSNKALDERNKLHKGKIIKLTTPTGKKNSN